MVILEVHIQLLIPHNAALAMDINQLEEEGVANQIVNQNDGSAEPSVRPLLWIRVRNVQPGNGTIKHLLRCLGDHTLDFILLCCGQSHFVLLQAQLARHFW